MSHKQVIIIRKDLNMRKGKIAAQAAHASMGALLGQCRREGDNLILALDERIKPWIDGPFKKICVYVNSEQELLDVYNKAKEAGLICCLIQDSGLTEFNGIKTHTTVAVGPDQSEKVDLITSSLPLF